MGKKRRRIVVVHEEDDEQVHEQPDPLAPAVAEKVAGPDESTARTEKKKKSSTKGKKNKVAGRAAGGGSSSPLQQPGSSRQELLCVQVVQSSCCECGAFKLVRGTLEQRWNSELCMYGSVIYQLFPLSGNERDSTCTPGLRIDACHFERAGSKLFDVQFLKPDTRSWCSGTLSADAPHPTTRWRLALSDGNSLTLELDSSADWLEIARFDADLPYDTDCRLSVPRASLTSSIDTIAPGLPAELRASLGKSQMRGRGSLFFSGIAFARHLALSSLPAASLLPHAAFLLNLDAAPFKTVKRWRPLSVMELLRQHSEQSSKPNFRPVYGNVQAKTFDTKDSDSGANEVYNGELALDCLAQIDKPDNSGSSDEDKSEDADGEAGRQYSESHALDRCYLHEVHASEALRLGCDLESSEELPSHCLNAIAQLQDKHSLGNWFAPFHESTPKFFGGDLGVCMAGHRDCVGIAQSCLQLRGYKLLLCDAGWSRSASMVRRYGGEAAGTAEDESSVGSTPMGAAEGVSISLDGKVPLTAAQLRLLDEVSESGSCALIAPGDLGVFHASNYHAASNDIATMSLAVYVAFVNWGGIRRLCAIQNYWSGSDDWVNTGDMMEQHIVASHLPGLRSQLQPLEQLAADEKGARASFVGSAPASSWLARACVALGQGSAAAAQMRVRVLTEAAERELPQAMDRLYVETEHELDIEEWELAPRSFAMVGAGSTEFSPEWAAAASTTLEDYNTGDVAEVASDDASSDEEAELEELMHKRSLLPLDVLLHGDPAAVNTETVFGVSNSVTERGLAAIGALGIPADQSGVGELMELATLKLLQSRQLDHAFGQFVLAAQLYASAHHGQVAGTMMWNQAVTLCTAVAVQLRRARVTAPAQLGAKTVADVDGGLVAPRLAPISPRDNLAALCDARLDAALALLKAAVKAPPLADGRGIDGHEVEEGNEWPPTVDELRQSEFLAVLRTCRPSDLEAVLASLPRN